MKKIICMILVFLMAISFLVPAVHAQEGNVIINGIYNPNTGRLSVSGSIPEGEGNAVFVEISGPAGIIYMDQVLSKTGGIFEFKGPVITMDGNYKISITREKGDAAKTVTINITRPSTDVPVVIPDTPPTTGQTPSNNDTGNKNIEETINNAVKNIDNKTAEQTAKDVLQIVKDFAALKSEDKAKTSKKIEELVEKTAQKLVKLDEKAMNKEETAGKIAIELKHEEVSKILESVEEIEKSLKNVQLENAASNIAAKKKQLTIELKDVVKEEIKIGIPVETIKATAQKDISIEIKTGSVTFNLPAKAVAAKISAEGTGASIQITAKEVKKEESGKLIEGIKEGTVNEKLVPASQIYDINMNLVKDNKVEKISTFEGEITIELPYLEGANEEKLGIYYYNPETKVWEYIGGKINKESRKMVFKTGHFSVYAVMEYNKTFDDVKDHWARQDIELMAAKHIVEGSDGNKFKPDDKITRAEFIALIVRALGLEKEKYSNCFKDISSSAWYADVVQTAYSNGLVKGNNGAFRPEDTITREELVTAVINAYKKVMGEVAVQGNIDKFEDKGQISSWAQDSVKAATALGFVQGRTPSKFAPKENATRAEAVRIIRYFLEKTIDK